MIQRYAYSLKGTSVFPMGIAFPKNETELIELVQYANQEKIAIYPLCKGKNWGYGSAQGTKAQQLIVDLSLLNQVLALDEELGYVTIQPGVTQDQLAHYLNQQQSRLQLDVTGAPKDTSLMGNFLERGFGHTNYGHRYESIINLKVLLPNGKIIKTGFGAFKNTTATNVFPQGIGPCLEGLFSQSNLGIVLEMTFALQPRPKYFCMFGLFCYHEDDLYALADVVRELRLQNIVNSAMHIANQARAVGKNTNPKLGHWIVTGSLSSASKAISNSKKKALKKLLKNRLQRHKLVCFTDKSIQRLEWFNQYIKHTPIIEGIRTTLALQKGIPTNQPTQTLLDHKHQEIPQFAQDFKANFLWLNAVCNAQSTSIKQLKGLVKQLFELYGYPLRVTFTSISPRSLIMIADIQYDNTPKAFEQAQAFYQTCQSTLINNGFYPYRSGSGNYKSYAHYLDKNHLELLQNLKTVVDPNRILAPDKYNIH